MGMVVLERNDPEPGNEWEALKMSLFLTSHGF